MLNPNFLINLGSTDEEIYRRLKYSGIKGQIKKPSCCPIANLIKKEFTISNISVTSNQISYGRFLAYEINTPGPVKEFIIKFDRGEYPDLIEEEQK